jgi:hypothetical protein
MPAQVSRASRPGKPINPAGQAKTAAKTAYDTAADTTAAARLWQVSADLAGVRYGLM